jgi:hypothetical protein
MSAENIFDLENTDDISADYKKSLFVQGIRADSQKLLDLFDKKSTLSIDEIGVAFYRLYNTAKPRSWILSNINNLVRRKLLSPAIERGYYQKYSYNNAIHHIENED